MDTETVPRIDTLDIKVSSRMEAISEVLIRIQAFFKTFDLPTYLITQNCVLVREILVNAIKHGHYFNPELTVDVRLEYLGENRFKIRVADSGGGFDPSILEQPSIGNFDTLHHRGFMLIRALSESYWFNEKGNVVTAVTLSFDPCHFG